MRARSRKHRTTVLIAAVFCVALSLAAAAFGADQTDRSFGQNGVAEIPLPPEGRKGGVEPGIWDLAEAPGSKMVAAIGDFSVSSYFGLARFGLNGALDTSFGNEGFAKRLEIPRREGVISPQAQAVAVQSDGKFVVVGYQENELSGTAPVLARYRSNGSLDPSFGHRGIVAPKPASEGGDAAHPVQGGGVLHDVAIQPSGRIIAVGAQNEFHGARPAGLVIAYKPDGRIDRSFGNRGRVLFPVNPRAFEYTALRSVKLLPDGKILVAGYRHGRLFLARLTRGGNLDRRFGGGDGTASLKINYISGQFCCPQEASLALGQAGQILVGAEGRRGRDEGLFLAGFSADGRLDRSFGAGGLLAGGTARRMPHPYDLAVQGNGRIVVVGEGPSTSEGSVPDLAALRLFPDGTLDRSFGRHGIKALKAGEIATAHAALTQSNGRVAAAGAFAVPSGKSYETTLLLTRYLPGSGG